MIQSRRQAHFYMVTCLCGLLPIVAIAALIWRPSVPRVAQDGLFAISDFADPSRTETIHHISPFQVKETEVLAKVLQQEGQMYLELQPQQDLEFADILVYWLPINATTDPIDPQAVLLGQLSGTNRRQFRLPTGLLESSTALLFYSRAQSQMIDTVTLNLQDGDA